MELDKLNGNNKWAEAVKYELGCINSYNVFENVGQNAPKITEGWKQIKVHFVFDVKHDGRFRGRLVADGYLTNVPVESVYSGVVSLRGIRLLTFLSELNKIPMWATDISSAYLEAYTKEKIFIKAGPEFGEIAGDFLIIRRALYGLRTSGARWHEKFATCLAAEGFSPCKAEPDIWMRDAGDCYEYVAVYVDDLAYCVKDPSGFVKMLETKHKFILKGTGPITFHLGCDFLRDEDGTLRLEPKKYIERVIASYERHFGCKPKGDTRCSSPLEKGDHPELDTSDLCGSDDIERYQSLVGGLQRLISLGRFDIATAVMTMSSFNAAPRFGHLKRVKRIVGYVCKMKEAALRIRTEEPDLSAVPIPDYDWTYSVYGRVQEQVPKDVPEPRGHYVQHTVYVDANLMHCLLTGRSVVGILHFVNGTPMDWYSKKARTVETATYGSELVAARTAVEQTLDMRLTLMYLGVPLRKRTYMFGDNQTVVNSATQPHGKLHKRHTMLSFHRVREAIASGMIVFNYIPSAHNPADILSKHWSYSTIWPLLRPLLFFRGDVKETIVPSSGE